MTAAPPQESNHPTSSSNFTSANSSSDATGGRVVSKQLPKSGRQPRAQPKTRTSSHLRFSIFTISINEFTIYDHFLRFASIKQ